MHNHRYVSKRANILTRNAFAASPRGDDSQDLWCGHRRFHIIEVAQLGVMEQILCLAGQALHSLDHVVLLFITESEVEG